jgi:hypothetical protein
MKPDTNSIDSIKIRFGGNGYHSYYRSLVFDHKGSLIKG